MKFKNGLRKNMGDEFYDIVLNGLTADVTDNLPEQTINNIVTKLTDEVKEHVDAQVESFADNIVN